MGATGLLVCLGTCGARMARSAGPRPVAITARKFSFSPRQVLASVGESLQIEIESLDFVHGFAIPQLGLRVDTPPGRTSRLLLADLKAGRYIYLCDNFCGEAHDQMSGTLVVA